MTPNRMPLITFVLGGLVVVAIVGVATGSWVWFVIALVVHLLATAIVITGAIKSTQTGEEADSRSQALDRKAGAAVGDEPRNVETELEALKRQ